MLNCSLWSKELFIYTFIIPLPVVSYVHNIIICIYCLKTLDPMASSLLAEVPQQPIYWLEMFRFSSSILAEGQQTQHPPVFAIYKFKFKGIIIDHYSKEIHTM